MNFFIVVSVKYLLLECDKGRDELDIRHLCLVFDNTFKLVTYVCPHIQNKNNTSELKNKGN